MGNDRTVWRAQHTIPFVLYLTVPTAGSRPDLLSALIRDCGLPPERIVVVVTREGVELPRGVIRIECTDTLNIQHWWNLGIEAAVDRGATFVAVSNDDVRLGAGALDELATALTDTGATLASPGPERLHVRRYLPFGRMLDGSLWVLDARTGLRPDEDFVWWFGDDDLDLRARRDHGGTVAVPVPFEHVHANQATTAASSLTEQTKLDAKTFRRKFRAVVLLSPVVRPILAAKDRVYLALTSRLSR